MGALRFALHPATLGVERPELRTAYVTGLDRVPWRTRVELSDGHLICVRQVPESGSLNVPWPVPDFGHVVLRTATLRERPEPYHLQLELARGKVNHLRNQAADWELAGLEMPASLRLQIRQVQQQFARALTSNAGPAAAAESAERAIGSACRAAEELARLYTDQVLQTRHQQYPRLGTLLGCRIGLGDRTALDMPAFREAFNAVAVRFTWRDVEPVEGEYNWGPFDELVDWCLEQKLVVTGGPLVLWTVQGVPDWLWLWEDDFGTVLSFMSDFVQAVIKRYQSRIRIWEIASRTNCGEALGISEEERLRLTIRALRVAHQTDPEATLTVTLGQPWAEYMARREYEYSPVHFADHLLRADLAVGSLGIELVMGYDSGASWSRDLLEVSSVLDQYAVLGVPLRVMLAAPSSRDSDSLARPDLEFGGGMWHGAWTEQIQADWAQQVAALVACKPFVQEVTWSHFSDSEPHEFPNAGLAASDGTAKPSLARLIEFRKQHLR